MSVTLGARSWIKVPSNLLSDGRSRRLARLLRDDRAWTYVLELALWCSRNGRNDSLVGLSDEVIAGCAGWEKSSAVFVRALLDAGFAEGVDRLGRLELVRLLGFAS